MGKWGRNKEAEAFHRACDAMLNEKSYDEEINEDSYRIAKSILSAGKGKICQYCMYQLKGECPFTITVRVKKRTCLRAYYIKLLKEQGLYGQPTNRKTGVD